MLLRLLQILDLAAEAVLLVAQLDVVVGEALAHLVQDQLRVGIHDAETMLTASKIGVR